MKTSPSNQVTVALDPGDTTGLACFDGEKLAFSASFSTPSIGDYVYVVRLLSLLSPHVIIVEREPHNGVPEMRARTALLRDRLQQVLPAATIAEVLPGHWKPAMRNRRSQLKSVHERDAIDMGRWWHESN